MFFASKSSASAYKKGGSVMLSIMLFIKGKSFAALKLYMCRRLLSEN